LSEFPPSSIKQLLESKLGIAYEEVKATDKIWQQHEEKITYMSDSIAYKKDG
jgi:spore germination cell wall hydrolase CwlJ-like protein